MNNAAIVLGGVLLAGACSAKDRPLEQPDDAGSGGSGASAVGGAAGVNTGGSGASATGGVGGSGGASGSAGTGGFGGSGATGGSATGGSGAIGTGGVSGSGGGSGTGGSGATGATGGAPPIGIGDPCSKPSDCGGGGAVCLVIALPGWCSTDCQTPNTADPKCNGSSAGGKNKFGEQNFCMYNNAEGKNACFPGCNNSAGVCSNYAGTTCKNAGSISICAG